MTDTPQGNAYGEVFDSEHTLDTIMDESNRIQQTPLMYALACILDQLTELTCTLNEMSESAPSMTERRRIVKDGVKDALQGLSIRVE